MSTYTPITSQTLTGSAASITFSNIPQFYSDLVIVVSPTLTSTEDLQMRFNSDTSSNYSYHVMWASGSATGTARASNQTVLRYSYVTDPATAGGTQSIININNYSNITTNKTIIIRTGLASDGLDLMVGQWRNTSAIESITLLLSGTGQYNTGSTFNLYGIATGSPKALGGNTVTTDGTYWYHTFISSGAFIPQEELTVDYLVVAGGGGGGTTSGTVGVQRGAGGGGAGGLRCTVGATGGGGSLETALSLLAQPYQILIGAGGTANINGNNTIFANITSIGGGGGGPAATFIGDQTGKPGGSGGGGYSTLAGGAGTTNQGFAGATTAPSGSGGGGGGAGEIGDTDGSGQGGDGVTTSINGSSVVYAGGGGGGGASSAGGDGGGGNGGSSTGAGNAGTPNTGGGGGGAGVRSSSNVGGAGGSGVVIVRYAV